MATKKQQPNKRAAKQQPKAQTKKPLGDPIEWSDSDLDALADISDADLLAADALWQAQAPTPVKNLLKAKVQEEGQTNENKEAP
jgi:hypothetical protein